MNRKITTLPSIVDSLIRETPAYGTVAEYADGSKFIYAYTALTDVEKGDTLAYTTTPNASGYNPQAAAAATSAIYHKYGVACQDKTAAGGLWLQIAGRCTFAKVDGTTDVAAGNFLKPANASRLLVIDHNATATASMVAVAEEAETKEAAAQTPITGSADHTIFLVDRWATVA